MQTFETKLDMFITVSKLSYNDSMLWYDILSNGFIPTYMPAEFVWKNRHRPWDWQNIQTQYELGAFMYVHRKESWSYRYMLNKYYA
jgi:hypothetical protein